MSVPEMPQAISAVRPRKQYSAGQWVTATVEKVLPYGAFVRLTDGTRAYIRRRELSLEGDRQPDEIVTEGQILQAMVLHLGGQGRLMELTLRAIHPDPWKEFNQKYKVGDVVIATVKHLTPTGVFAQIIPGVNGFIPLKELASWDVEKAEDVVWTEDEVEAVITQIDVPRQRVNLSIRRRMEQLVRVEALFRQISPGGNASETPSAETVEGQDPTLEESTSVIGQIGPILVVDDHDFVREPLVRWLTRQGYTAYGAREASDALALCQKQRYGLILVDLDLPQVDGLQLIRHIRERGERTFVAVMSSAEWIEEHFLEIQQTGVSEVFPKPLNYRRLRQFLLRLGRGEIIEPCADLTRTPPPEIQTARQLAAIMRSRLPLAQRFCTGLAHLLETTRAEKAIVFHLDRASRIVSIVADEGDIPLNESAIYSLVASPVKDVILEGETIWENRVSQERTRRFEKLLELLPFESCIGMPVEAGAQIEYALFLFHREPDAFSRYRLRDAWAMATYFAVAVEQDALDRRIREISRILLSGHLAAGLGHEIYNRLSGLDLDFQNIHFDVASLCRQYPELEDAANVGEIRRALDKAIKTARGLTCLVEDFRRLLRATQEEQVADVNEVIRQSISLVQPEARRAKVTLRPPLLSPDMPPVAGSSVGLQHVFLNLMLNAIQHMALKPEERRVLEISTACEGDDLPVKIRFSDTGPGIHRQLWEKIFTLGFTTRPGGSGLGLYIARSLVESMGGRISVEKSLVPLGTTFLVELPLAKEE